MPAPLLQVRPLPADIGVGHLPSEHTCPGWKTLDAMCPSMSKLADVATKRGFRGAASAMAEQTRGCDHLCEAPCHSKPLQWQCEKTDLPRVFGRYASPCDASASVSSASHYALKAAYGQDGGCQLWSTSFFYVFLFFLCSLFYFLLLIVLSLFSSCYYYCFISSLRPLHCCWQERILALGRLVAHRQRRQDVLRHTIVIAIEAIVPVARHGVVRRRQAGRSTRVDTGQLIHAMPCLGGR